jgi:hypothetical protein
MNEPPIETYQLSVLSADIEVRNLTKIRLSPSEKAAIEYAWRAVVEFTNGKIASRVARIDLVDAGDVRVTAGEFTPYDRIAVINLGGLRKLRAPLRAQYKPYFASRPAVTNIAVTLAHELGHAMDIGTVQEADAYSISKDDYAWMALGDRTRAFSYFQSHFGWRHRIVEGDITDKDIWWLPAAARTAAVTPYAATSPQEDFAETFAFFALGGEFTERFRERRDVLAKGIALARSLRV